MATTYGPSGYGALSALCTASPEQRRRLVAELRIAAHLTAQVPPRPTRRPPPVPTQRSFFETLQARQLSRQHSPAAPVNSPLPPTSHTPTSRNARSRRRTASVVLSEVAAAQAAAQAARPMDVPVLARMDSSNGLDHEEYEPEDFDHHEPEDQHGEGAAAANVSRASSSESRGRRASQVLDMLHSAEADKYSLALFNEGLPPLAEGSADAGPQGSSKRGLLRPPAELGGAGASDSAEDGSAPPPPPADVPDPQHKSGFLLKSPGGRRFGGMGKWRRRWFQLHDKVLVYFANEQSKVPKGMIALKNIEIFTDGSSLGRTPTKHAILLRTERGARLCADTHEAILEWFRAIVNNASIVMLQQQRENGDAPPPPPPSNAEPELPDLAMFYPQYQPPKTHYELIGVSEDASKSLIKRSYYRLAKEYHPDRNPDADPHMFAALSKAYAVIYDAEGRAEYDLSQRIKEACRQGFDCIMHRPIYDDGALAPEIPVGLEEIAVTLFTDGESLRMYFQPVAADSNQLEPLRPDTENSIEMRFVQQVLYGRDDPLFKSLWKGGSDEGDAEGIEVPPEEECRIALTGERLDRQLYIELDCPESCNEFVKGLRVIRCEKSMLQVSRA